MLKRTMKTVKNEKDTILLGTICAGYKHIYINYNYYYIYI